MPTAWSIVFYEEKGRRPVAEFLEGLDQRTQVRFAWSMEQLLARNVMAREPLVKHIEGKLWELREESGTNIYRILYYASSGRRFVLLHAFQKKSQRTPRREIETAMERMRRFEAKERGR